MTKILKTVLAAGLVLSVAAPIAAEAAAKGKAPKTEKACAKVKNMKWNAETKVCEPAGDN